MSGADPARQPAVASLRRIALQAGDRLLRESLVRHRPVERIARGRRRLLRGATNPFASVDHGRIERRAQAQAGSRRAARARLQAAAAVPVRRHHPDRGHAGGHSRHHRAGRRANRHGRCRRKPCRQVVRQEPGLQRRAERGPAAPVAGPCCRALPGPRLEHAVRALCIDLPRPDQARRRAGARAAGCLVRAGAAGPRHPGCARTDHGALLRRDDRSQCAGHRGGGRADARPCRLRPARVCEQTAPGPNDCRAAHGRSGRSHRRRRPGAGRSRRRWPARDARGGGARLSAGLLQAQGRRQRRGRSRSPDQDRGRARSRRRATTAPRSTATSSTTASRASPSCGGALGRRRRLRGSPPPRSSSSSRSSGPRPCRAPSMRWPGSSR